MWVLGAAQANASGVGHIDNCKASLSANLAQINKACCTQAGMCDSANPVPISCTESCGAVFVPWFKQCGKPLGLLPQNT